MQNIIIAVKCTFDFAQLRDHLPADVEQTEET